MRVFTSIAEWQCHRSRLKTTSLGFVPTMGALHRGHLSLVEASKKQNAMTVVSIFINPGQFNDAADFEAYPADHRNDLDLLEKAAVDVVILPNTAQVYADDYRFKVTENDFSQRLCGAHRPGHFDGVLTVVMRLLNLVRPDNAYFGEKDYQQLQLIRDMTTAFFIPVNIVACATVREADGLAMSSRNQRLDAPSRAQAAALYAALKSSGSASEAKAVLRQQGFEVDYVEDITGRRLAAAQLGDTRLIDNVEI
jgi:pantoate--beta-alanine ligase